MKNTFINTYRKTVKHQQIFKNNEDLFTYSENKSEPVGYRHLQEEEIGKTIQHLNEKFKVPFLLYFQGFSYAEIAQMQKLKMGTVKSRIFYARKILKKELHEFLN